MTDPIGLKEARVCRGCGCTSADACLVRYGEARGKQRQGRCFFVADDLCFACFSPDSRLRGPSADHRPATTPPPRPLTDLFGGDSDFAGGPGAVASVREGGGQ